MSADILDKIDDTLTYYSAGLDAEVTVPVEKSADRVTLGFDGTTHGVNRSFVLFVPEGLRSAFRAAATAEQAAIYRELRDLITAALGLPTVPLTRFRVSAKGKRRRRRAQLRRVHRDYVQRNRRRLPYAYGHFVIVDETRRAS